MENFTWFLGIDVSKSKLDLTLQKGPEKVDYRAIENNTTSIRAYFRMLKNDFKVQLSECLVCMEYTGIYNNHLLQVGDKLCLKIWIESAASIKLSAGVSRIKNDKVDSFKIAMYAYRFKDKARLWVKPRRVLCLLDLYSKRREKLVKIKHMLQVEKKDNLIFLEKDIAKEIDVYPQLVKKIDALIKKIEAKIEALINGDEQIKELAKIITSVPGVGRITAVKMITTTKEFKEINDPRKYACYGGVAPFERSSGSSIRGKTQVSKKANLSVKTMLSLCAASAIQHDPDMGAFYQRKVAEGKQKMSVINAVRNKIIHRVFACVNQNRLYEKKYQNVLA